MSNVYYTAEPSATLKGFVGLVIDAQTQRVVSRTLHGYASRELAIIAAKRAKMWGVLQQEVAA